jgi:hypothetical protein
MNVRSADENQVRLLSLSLTPAYYADTTLYVSEWLEALTPT